MQRWLSAQHRATRGENMEAPFEHTDAQSRRNPGAARAAEVEVAIVGAGPYGLSAAIHLRRAGIETAVFGECMSFWRTMPKGMLLRSNWSATNIAEPRGPLSLDAYQGETGARIEVPVPLESFVEYGEWVQQQAVADLVPRLVLRVDRNEAGFLLELEDGQRVSAQRVVIAAGIAPFASRPKEFDHLAVDLASHTGSHSDFARFKGQRIGIVGGGQSALESAALLHEAGAAVEVFIRRESVVWLRGVGMKKRLGRLGPVVYAPTDVGPLWYSRLVARPDVFRRLPRRLQTPIARRSIRPAGSDWVRVRLDDVPLHVGCTVVKAEPADKGLTLTLDNGATAEVDHLLVGTGYRVDVGRYRFLAPALITSLRRVDGYPVLGPGLESSVAGLHFLGAPAAWSFGPIMRFVSGSWYASNSLARTLRRRRAAGQQ